MGAHPQAQGVFTIIVREILSNTNATLKRLRSLQTRSAREQSGLFLIEGRKLIAEAHSKKIELVDVVVSQTFADTELDEEMESHFESVSIVNDQLFKSLYTTTSTCGIVASANQPFHTLESCLKAKDALIVVGDAIQDPGNLGTVVRSCLAFSVDCVVLLKGSVDSYSPKVVRASMGAVFAMPVAQLIETDLLKEALHKMRIDAFALDGQANRPYWEAPLNKPAALFFGNEGNGLAQSSLDLCQDSLAIPISDSCESLNVAISVGIVLCEANRQRMSASPTR